MTSKDNTEGDFIKSLNNRDKGQISIYLLSFLCVGGHIKWVYFELRKHGKGVWSKLI